MKRFNKSMLPIWLLSVGLTVAGVLLIGYQTAAWGLDSSGMRLVLRVPDEQNDLHYLMGAADHPVTVIMSLCNETGKPIATEREFSLTELHHALKVTDPIGKHHFIQHGNKIHKMPQPYFLNNQAWALAKELPATLPSGDPYCTSTTVSDLRELVEVMKTTPGIYRITAQMPFVRFAATGHDAGLGTIGLLDSDQNWSGAIRSESALEIFIDPPAGAQVRVQVYDESTDPAGTPFHVLVKVYRTEDIQGYASLADTWAKALPLITKTTDTNGQAVLTYGYGAGCLSQDDYTIIAKYAEDYQENTVAASEGGWVTGNCSGEIATEIAFTGVQEPEEIPGDLNGDGVVNMADVQVVVACFGQTVTSNPDCAIADVNNDGLVNILDVSFVVSNFTQ